MSKHLEKISAYTVEGNKVLNATGEQFKDLIKQNELKNLKSLLNSGKTKKLSKIP